MAAFERWTDRLDAAGDDDARRALLAEIGGWRATRLTDVPALRDAAWAMSRLHAALGDADAATREAQALVSLCQTPPEASREQLAAATAWLEELGGRSVVAPSRGGRGGKAAGRDKRERKPRARVDSSDPVALARADRFDDALSTLRGKRGPRAQLLRAWIQVRQALASDGARQRQLLEDLERRLAPDAPAAAEPAAPAGAPAADRTPRADDPLEQLVGRSLPKKRGPRLEILESWASENPGRIDELASTALRQHVATAGTKAPAPWLVGFVARALASGPADRTQSALADLRSRGAFAVTAYQERPFDRVVEVASEAMGQGWDVTAIRRGVLSRVEPTDRRLWTVRLVKDFVERMLVVAPPADSPYEGDIARVLAERIVSLCPRVVLLAPGPGNASLRDEAGQLGVTVHDRAVPGELLVSLEQASELAPPETETAPARPARKEKRAPERAPEPTDALRALLSAPEAPSADALAEVLSGYQRVHRAFAPAEAVLSERPLAEVQDRVAALLEAAHRVAPESARLQEGATLLVRAAGAAGTSGPLGALLDDSSLVSRYGGPGLRDVIALSSALQGAGFTVRRALRGPTGREKREDPVVDAVGDAAEGLWRLLVHRGDVRGEVWFIADVPPEGRAAIPRLLARERQRVVVVPVEADLLSWYAGLGGPQAIGWTGDETDAVLSEVEGWASEGATA